MSVFNRNTVKSYVDDMRKFLNMNRKGFLHEAGLIEVNGKCGRPPRYPTEAVRNIEKLVNAKAARVEDKNTDLGERIRLARDYALMTDSELGRRMGVTREAVRLWAKGETIPKDLERLARTLNVPQLWLSTGETSVLPANSSLGVRVGEEQSNHKERLYALTQQVLGEIEAYSDETAVQTYLEQAVFNRAALAHAARKAGGRWQLIGGNLRFAPWIPPAKKELSRRMWSDEVESIIEEELSRPGQSTYKAWETMVERFQNMGLTKAYYPSRIALFKRQEKKRRTEAELGINLSTAILDRLNKLKK